MNERFALRFTEINTIYRESGEGIIIIICQCKFKGHEMAFSIYERILPVQLLYQEFVLSLQYTYQSYDYIS